MLFYLDENVAASVKHVLEGAGHIVVWTREITNEGAEDDIVAAVAELANATLISHDKDFKKIAPNIPDGQRRRFRNLNMIRLMCTKPRAAERMSVVLPYIEFDAIHRQNSGGRRSIIEIKTDLFSIFS